MQYVKCCTKVQNAITRKIIKLCTGHSLYSEYIKEYIQKLSKQALYTGDWTTDDSSLDPMKHRRNTVEGQKVFYKNSSCNLVTLIFEILASERIRQLP